MKKITVAILYLLLVNIKVFPSFEMNFQIPVSINVSLTKTEGNYAYKQNNKYVIDYGAMGGNALFNVSFLMSMGENFYISDKTIRGISILTELGYERYAYNTTLNIKKAYDTYKYNLVEEYTMVFHTIVIGGIFKLNTYADFFADTSIGIGAGVKIPISGNEKIEAYRGNYGNDLITYKENYNFLQLKELFKYPIIPYIKLVFDSPMYKIGSKAAITWRSYLAYNFGMEWDIKKPYYDLIIPIFPPSPLTKHSFSSFECGLAIGMSIGGFSYNRPATNNTKMQELER